MTVSDTKRHIVSDSLRREVPKEFSPESIERQIAAFFKSGGKVQHLPAGATADLLLTPTEKAKQFKISKKTKGEV